MPVITRSGGKVTAIWGKAQIRDEHGKMHALHVGDLVKTGDVILTTQNGIVRIANEADPVAVSKPAQPSDTDRVISGLNQGDLDVAPGAGLVGGDGGSLSEGFRVGRIAEGVTPASMGLPQYEESTLEDLPNVIRAEVLPLALVPVEPPPPAPPPVEPPPPPPPPAPPPPPVGEATVRLSASQAPEGDDAGYTFTATLSAASQGVTTIVTDKGTIYIQDGDTTGSITVYVPPNGEDVYVDPSSLAAQITSATGGNFEGLEIGTGSATATIVDTIDITTVTLSATASVTEGGSIVYTASLDNPVTGSPLVIQLNNGTTITITIPVGSSSANSDPVPVRADDPYVQGTDTITAAITGTSGGNFEALNTSSTASTLVTDDSDITTVQLLSTRLDGSGNYFITASIDNAPQNTPLVLRLSNGASLTFGIGQTTADSTAVAVPRVPADSPELIVRVTSAEGGNFESLNTEDMVVAPLVVSVDIPVVTPITNPQGLSVEYYGYNDFNPTSGNANRQHSDDGTFGNLDSVAKVTALINGRNSYYYGGNVVGSTVATQDNATDVRFTATTLDYGRINAVNNSLGTNPDVAAGAGSPISINRTNSELFKFVNKTPASAPIDLRVTLGTPDNDNLSTGPTSGLGKTSDAAMRFTGQAYLNAGLYDIRVTADDGFRLRLDDQTVAIFDGVQTATTRVYSGVAIEGGLTPLELLYWDEGSKAVLRVEFKLTGDLDSSYKVLGSSTLPLFSDVNAPVLTELQDIVAGAKAGTYAVRTGSLLQGGAGDDQLTGGDARDHLIGGDGRDVLAGGAASDVIEGGKADDQLTGGLGHDVFRWSLGDAGSTTAPAHDVISDFDNTSYAGDVLDLRDLLTGETHAANTMTLPNPIGLTNALTITSDAGKLESYLHFSTVINPQSGLKDTVIEISSKGSFTAGSHAGADQVITLANIDLTTGFSSDTDIIKDLLARGKLLADVAPHA
jgi:Ca2+-binding RTX toxin-like protein